MDGGTLSILKILNPRCWIPGPSLAAGVSPTGAAKGSRTPAAYASIPAPHLCGKSEGRSQKAEVRIGTDTPQARGPAKGATPSPGRALARPRKGGRQKDEG